MPINPLDATEKAAIEAKITGTTPFLQGQTTEAAYQFYKLGGKVYAAKMADDGKAIAEIYPEAGIKFLEPVRVGADFYQLNFSASVLRARRLNTRTNSWDYGWFGKPDSFFTPTPHPAFTDKDSFGPEPASAAWQAIITPAAPPAPTTPPIAPTAPPPPSSGTGGIGIPPTAPTAPSDDKKGSPAPSPSPENLSFISLLTDPSIPDDTKRGFQVDPKNAEKQWKKISDGQYLIVDKTSATLSKVTEGNVKELVPLAIAMLKRMKADPGSAGKKLNITGDKTTQDLIYTELAQALKKEPTLNNIEPHLLLQKDTPTPSPDEKSGPAPRA